MARTTITVQDLLDSLLEIDPQYRDQPLRLLVPKSTASEIVGGRQRQIQDIDPEWEQDEDGYVLSINPKDSEDEDE